MCVDEWSYMNDAYRKALAWSVLKNYWDYGHSGPVLRGPLGTAKIFKIVLFHYKLPKEFAQVSVLISAVMNAFIGMGESKNKQFANKQ